MKNFHPHLWGGEIHLVNSELYCSKFLCLKKGFQSSYHYHNIKDETFVCLFGNVKVELGKVPHPGKKIEYGEPENIVILKPGDTLRLKPRQDIHRFQAISMNPTTNKGAYLQQTMDYLKTPYPVQLGIITNIYDAVLLEISTHDEITDNVKLEQARRINDSKS